MRTTRIIFTAVMTVLGLSVFALAPRAEATDLGPSSTSCAFGVCVWNPTPICISDQPTCPYAPPVCYYTGEEPFGLKHLSCHDPRPAPNPGTYTGVCIGEEGHYIICVGGENQADGPDYICPWVNWVVDRTGYAHCDLG